MEASYRYFQNKDCKYFPCHPLEGDFNCLFCYCPLYPLDHCPGNYEIITSQSGRQIKSCMNCTFPHQPENYDTILKFLSKGM